MAETKDAGATCPYCGSRFETGEQLSRHTDRVHNGSGLLEGDSRQF